MQNASRFSSIALLIGEPSRAAMLWKILDGGMHTATALAVAADKSPSNASMHLAKLVNAGLLSVVKRGRLRYYQFRGPEVPYVIEAIANLVPKENLMPQDDVSNSSRIKYCRTCYDHLAGKVGVAITDKMLAQKIIKASHDDFSISESGIKWFKQIDISIPDLEKGKRAIIRKCIDWSEKRPHMSGAVGAAFADRLFEMKWLQRTKNSRIVSITPVGQKKIHDLLGLIL